MENAVRPDTAGKIEPIAAKYELLPRGQYTYVLPTSGEPVPAGPKVSTGQYESTLQVYEAQNAVQIAQSLGAEQYAPDVMAKAKAALAQARQMNDQHGERSGIVMEAREAAERAEDARMIALDHLRDQAAMQAQIQAGRDRQMLLQAEARAKTAQAEAAANQQLLEQERAARERAEARATAASVPAPAPPPAPAAQAPDAPQPDTGKIELRGSLRQEMNAAFPTLDTPRGLVATVADSDFQGMVLRRDAEARLARLGAVLRAHPGLMLQVAGNAGENSVAEERIASDRAGAVRDALVQAGIPDSLLTVRSLGGSRPLVSNNTAYGREQNRRVEITIAGDAIGTMPTWDRSYSITRR
jgi:outer membrane protein OmpA-like peptidoglycan-associated protein